MLIQPPTSKNRIRICGETSLNLYFYIFNFLKTSKSYKIDTQTFKRVVYRQKLDLNKSADKNAKLLIKLAISQETDNHLIDLKQDKKESIEQNQSLYPLSDFSKISWNPNDKNIIDEKRFNLYYFN